MDLPVTLPMSSGIATSTLSSEPSLHRNAQLSTTVSLPDVDTKMLDVVVIHVSTVRVKAGRTAWPGCSAPR